MFHHFSGSSLQCFIAWIFHCLNHCLNVSSLGPFTCWMFHSLNVSLHGCFISWMFHCFDVSFLRCFIASMFHRFYVSSLWCFITLMLHHLTKKCVVAFKNFKMHLHRWRLQHCFRKATSNWAHCCKTFTTIIYEFL